MSREDIVAIASRLFAVFLLLLSIRLAGGLVAQAGSGPSLSTLLAFTVLPTVLASALLWFFPLSVARKLLPVMRESRPVLSPRAIEVEMLAFSVLGLWVIAGAVPDLFYWIVFAATVSGSDSGWDFVSLDNKVRIGVTVVRLAIGVWLLLGSTGLARVLHRFRFGAAPKES